MTGTPSGLLLHLSGPLQSWGTGDVPANLRDSSRYPTRSGLIGLLACALGRTRDQRTDDLRELTFTIRVDRPGTFLRDFQTVGGGMPRELTVITAEGKRRSAETATVVSERYYRQDAAFTVLVEGPPETVAACGQAVRCPRWPLFLGRRSCPPDAPLFLALTDGPEPARELLRLPLARRPFGGTTVEFIGGVPFTAPFWPEGQSGGRGDVPFAESRSDPVSFASDRRVYRPWRVYRLVADLDGDLHTSPGPDFLERLISHFSMDAA
ncbi:type I-E CRISPR-associated protein Cas5/CasD [Actinocorallia sp. API 0066]|uniref:type I-E CRISPR-associated protein Cas5/CasD n=1 Tax=Actinocorallia sp. API 0066 TaxID=2896846 RepID=UPI001E298523|nr:type I-E CRISPR-associated protein Cas5/CasD [Actinocorallia sp. API 0066]MCD0452558.1 type I-E CRISPR-associated protein Cas5/CasD [Actinocorallia sp. API 0066]